MNRKLLITGCNGFVGGKAVSRFLGAGDEVWGLDKFGDPPAGVQFRRAAVSAESLSAFGMEFDAILHIAGTGSVGAAASDPEAARRDTVEASVAVLDYLREHPQTKLIYVSSAAVYGNAGGVLSEELPRNPISVYGKLKAEVEDLCQTYHDQYGCRINIIRPFSIYGAGLRKQLLWDFCGRVAAAQREGKTALPCFGTGREMRDFINIEDVIGLVAQLVERGPDWLVVNAGTGVATPVDDVLTAICRAMNFTGRLEYDRVTRDGDPQELVADTRRLQELGFKPTKSFAAGISEYVDWYIKDSNRRIDESTNRRIDESTNRQIIKVGFLNYFSSWWMGGVTYFKNLFQAMQTVEQPVLKPYILKPAESCADTLLEIATVMDQAEIPWSDLSHLPTAADYGMNVISHLQETRATDGIAWIADFQHKHLPEMFSAEEIAKRDRDFEFLAKSNRLVILSSNDACRDFATYYPAYAHKARRLRFVSIPEPGALADFQVAETCARLGIPERFFYVPNQFWKHKNHIVVFKAVARLKQRGINVTVVCSGKTVDARFPGYFEELMEFCKREGIEENVKVVGLIDRQDVYFLQRQCVSLINPSRFEGWSSSVEEAKSIGKTIILSNLKVHIEQDPPEGRFFPVDDDARLADLMESAWKELPPGPDAKLEKLARERLPERIHEFGEEFKAIVLEALSGAAVLLPSAPSSEEPEAEVAVPAMEIDRAVKRLGPFTLRLTTTRFRFEVAGRVWLEIAKWSKFYRWVKRTLNAMHISTMGIVYRVGKGEKN